MKDINTIYYNDFGISFQWKRNTAKDIHKIQVVFNNTGLYLTPNEIFDFLNYTKASLKQAPLCEDCEKNKSCKSILLQTPAHQVSFAVSYPELIQIYDLLNGTLFNLGLDNVLKKFTINRISND